MPVVKIVYGIHLPRVRSDEEILRLCDKMGIASDIYRISNYSANTVNNYQYLGNVMPDILLFNSKGVLVQYNRSCSSHLIRLVEVKVMDIDTMTETIFTWEDVSSTLYLIQDNDEETISMSKPLFLIKVAEYMGNVNKKYVPDQIRILEGRSDVDYAILNMDFTILANKD